MQIPPVAQTGRQRLPLSIEDEALLLKKRREADRTDLFATDPDAEVRRVGRLALRRDGVFIGDYLELADLCAQLSIQRPRSSEDNPRLRVFYVGKTIAAFRRALNITPNDNFVPQALNQYIRWIFDVAAQFPTRLNIATALWVVAHEDIPSDNSIFSEAEFDALLSNYRNPSITSQTISDNELDDLSSTTTDDASAEHSVFATIPADDDASHGIVLETEHQVEVETRAGLEDDIAVSFLSRVDELSERNDETRSGDSLHLAADPPESFDTLGPRIHGSAALVREKENSDGDYQVGQGIGNRFEIRQKLYGGMGLVYLCYDKKDKIPVAIKTFQSKFLKNERAVARFTQEALTWIRVEKHRHIVQALKVQKFDERPFIILEHISGPEGLGPDLRSWIDHNQIDLLVAVELGLHICLGMQHATRQVPGLVHRDLKPGNVLVTQDQVAKVTDFGLVHSLELDDISSDDPTAENHPSRLTRAGAVVGTAPYMSPEQCRSDEVDMRSDIYSFGCVLYEMLTRHTVFNVSNFADWVKAHKFQTPEFPEETPFEIPERLQAITLACLEKPAGSRPQTWGEIVDELAIIYEDITGEAPNLEESGLVLEVNDLLDKAYSLTELDYIEEALIAYDKALELEPRNARSWARKARALRIMGEYAEALASVNRSLEIHPQFGWGWIVKGQILERMGHFERALAAHEISAEIKPGDVRVWYNQACALFSLGRWDDALNHLDHALSIDPHHESSWAKRGQILRYQGHFLQGLNAYNRALELNPSFSWAWNGKGLCLKALKRLDEAYEAFQHAAYHQNDDVWIWYNQAETLFELGRYEEAVDSAKAATKVQFDHFYSWAKIGQIYRYLDRYEDALKAYEQAIALNPTYAWAINGQGIVLERLERYDEAFIAYRKASELTPKDVWPWYNQGNLLVIQDKFKEAIPLLERAVKENPAHARSWARLGNAHRRLGDEKAALVYLDRALKIDAGYAWAWNEKGITFEALKQYNEALDAYKRAANAESSNALYWYNQADLLV